MKVENAHAMKERREKKKTETHLYEIIGMDIAPEVLLD